MKKVCKRCGEEKELEQFGAHKSYKDGYLSVCKFCRNSALRAERAAKRSTKFDARPGFKICRRCGSEKRFDEFYKSSFNLNAKEIPFL